MLTDTQREMISYQIGRLIDILTYIFVRRLPKDKQSYNKVAEIIDRAISNEYQSVPYTRNSVNTTYNQSIIAHELNGIFNPDLQVLQTLHIINNPRDVGTASISDEITLHEISGEIREYALQILPRNLEKYPALIRYMGYEDKVRETANEPRREMVLSGSPS